VVEQLLGLAGVFAGDAVGGAEDAQSAEGNVFKVADGSGYQVETGSEGAVGAREFWCAGFLFLGGIWVVRGGEVPGGFGRIVSVQRFVCRRGG
jgi:hypothetical protein